MREREKERAKKKARESEKERKKESERARLSDDRYDEQAIAKMKHTMV